MKMHVQRDRQTDGQTDRHRTRAQTALMHSVARYNVTVESRDTLQLKLKPTQSLLTDTTDCRAVNKCNQIVLITLT